MEFTVHYPQVGEPVRYCEMGGFIYKIYKNGDAYKFVSVDLLLNTKQQFPMLRAAYLAAIEKAKNVHPADVF